MVYNNAIEHVRFCRNLTNIMFKIYMKLLLKKIKSSKKFSNHEKFINLKKLFYSDGRKQTEFGLDRS